MEYCNGGDLYHKLLKVEKLSEKNAKRIIKQTLLALKHLHDHNIAHRDLKLENILFIKDDIKSDIKLIDFGISAILDNPKEIMNATVGTPLYFAPEVLYEEGYDM